MSWTTKVQIMTAENVAASAVASSVVQLKSHETAHVQVQANFPGSPTDSIDITIQTSLDGTVWDTEDLSVFTTINIPNTNDPARASFSLTGYAYFRVVATRNGSTDTIVVDMWYSRNANYLDDSRDI